MNKKSAFTVRVKSYRNTVFRRVFSGINVLFAVKFFWGRDGSIRKKYGKNIRRASRLILNSR